MGGSDAACVACGLPNPVSYSLVSACPQCGGAIVSSASVCPACGLGVERASPPHALVSDASAAAAYAAGPQSSDPASVAVKAVKFAIAFVAIVTVLAIVFVLVWNALGRAGG
jgi:predicted amidophosphoribosyltransferase